VTKTIVETSSCVAEGVEPKTNILRVLLRESANGGDEPAAAMLREARRISEEMIRKSEFNPA